ncbi:MAG: hypothetical protein JW904_11885 [Spirochaetales bacterium]|nr:hypothetical protein [Spirochaetales bacterium]
MLDFTKAVAGSSETIGAFGGVVMPTVTSNSPDGYYKNNFNMAILLKYSFKAGFLEIWPTLGYMYNWFLAADINGDGIEENLSGTELNDYFLILGCGFDIFIGSNFFISIVPLFYWDLTAVQQKDYEPNDNESFIMPMLNAQFCLGWRF